MFAIIQRQMSFSYRYGNSKAQPTDSELNFEYSGLTRHNSFYIEAEGVTRFFGVDPTKEEYPVQ